MSSFNRKKLKFLGISLATLTATTVTLVACGNESKNSGDNCAQNNKVRIGLSLKKSEIIASPFSLSATFN